MPSSTGAMNDMWPWGRLTLQQNWAPEIFPGG